MVKNWIIKNLTTFLIEKTLSQEKCLLSGREEAAKKFMYICGLPGMHTKLNLAVLNCVFEAIWSWNLLYYIQSGSPYNLKKQRSFLHYFIHYLDWMNPPHKKSTYEKSTEWFPIQLSIMCVNFHWVTSRSRFLFLRKLQLTFSRLISNKRVGWNKRAGWKLPYLFI